MADGRTQIIVALIGVAGVLGAAYIARGGGSASPASSPTPAGAAASLPTEAATKLSQSQERAYDGAASALDSISEQIEASNTPAKPPSIAGSWHDDAGYRFDFVQSGNSYTFRQYLNGVYDGYGQGTLSGRKFSHKFEATSGLKGTCSGEISADLKTSGGNCSSIDGDQWQFFVKR